MAAKLGVAALTVAGLGLFPGCNLMLSPSPSCEADPEQTRCLDLSVAVPEDLHAVHDQAAATDGNDRD